MTTNGGDWKKYGVISTGTALLLGVIFHFLLNLIEYQGKFNEQIVVALGNQTKATEQQTAMTKELGGMVNRVEAKLDTAMQRQITKAMIDMVKKR